MLKMQLEMSEAIKINQFLLHLRNEALQTIRRKIPATNEHLNMYSSFSDESIADHNYKRQQNTTGINSLLTLTQNHSPISLSN